MKLWGVITEVNSKDLVVSLPGGLRGFVRSEEVADIVLNNGSQVLEMEGLENKPIRITLLFPFIFLVMMALFCRMLGAICLLEYFMLGS